MTCSGAIAFWRHRLRHPGNTYNDDYTGNDEIVLARLWMVREDRTFKMEQAVFEKLKAYGDPKKAKSWFRNLLHATSASGEPGVQR